MCLCWFACEVGVCFVWRLVQVCELKCVCAGLRVKLVCGVGGTVPGRVCVCESEVVYEVMSENVPLFCVVGGEVSNELVLVSIRILEVVSVCVQMNSGVMDIYLDAALDLSKGLLSEFYRVL